MNKVCLILTGVFLCLAHKTSATPQITVSGLSVFPYWRSGSTQSLQFDQAVNLEAHWQYTEKTAGYINLQSSVGNGKLGFPGPEIVITDVGIQHQLSPRQHMHIGSFDMPLGQEVSRLTNNAALGDSGFVINPLLYTALAGPSGTLNTVGIMLTQALQEGEVKFFVSNGTGESAINEDTHLAYGMHWTTGIGTATLGLSSMYSQDTGDKTNTSADSLQAETGALLLDAQIEENGTWYGGHIGQLWISDGTKATNTVAVGMAGLSLPVQEWTVHARISYWLPGDNDGNSTGISAQIPDPSLAKIIGLTVPKDRSVLRYQIGISQPIEKALFWGTEICIDHPNHGSSSTAIISHIALNF